jgi:hypothetical protein
MLARSKLIEIIYRQQKVISELAKGVDHPDIEPNTNQEYER